MNRVRRYGILTVLLVAAAVGGYAAWRSFADHGLPEGIAAGNGRIEAVEIDIASKTAGRIREILVDEGDFVEAGQVLARMDTAQLEAQKREAQAKLQRAVIAIDTANALVTQRLAERDAAEAVIAQREAQLDAAERKLARSSQLVKTFSVSEQTFDDDRASREAAKAAVAAAKADLAAADAAISSARAQVVDANAAVAAQKAAIESIEADIDDSVLTSPRSGRVQYRVAQPGEVLSAGGRVLNLIDVGDVYMTFFLPTAQAGQVRLGAEARLALDALPAYLIPAKVSYVADVAQFTPKTVETEEERQKLMFRIKARIAPELLRKYVQHVKTGLPGMAYVQLDPAAPWPATLTGTLVQ